MKLTREGRIAALCTAFLLIIAFNTGVNLTYAMFSIAASAFIVSAAFSILNLLGISANGTAKHHVFEGDIFSDEAVIENRGLLARCLLHFSADGSRSSTVCLLRPREKESLKFERVLNRRGLYRGIKLAAATRFPFGLLETRRTVDVASEVLVYPKPALPGDIRFEAAEKSFTAGSSRGHKTGRGDFFDLRQYEEGDPLKLIHWPSSARTGNLLVRQLEDEESKTVVVAVDNVSAGVRNAPWKLDEEARIAAGIVKEADRLGYATQVAFWENSPRRTAAGKGRSHLFGIYEQLALLEPREGATFDDVISSAQRAAGRTANVFCIRAAGGRIPCTVSAISPPY